MRLGLLLGGEDAGALERDVHAQVLVRQLGGVTLGGDLDAAVARHLDVVAVDLHLGRETAVHAVVAQQVGVGLDRAQVVDGDDLDVAAAMLGDGAQDQTSDAAEAVDGDANSHGSFSCCGRRIAFDRRSLFRGAFCGGKARSQGPRN